MNEHRKKIIISEIKYWKQKKLLPAHYCDFLIALYARGGEEEEEVKETSSFLSGKKKRENRMIMMLFLFVVSFSVLLLLDIYPVLMLGLSGLFLLISLLYPIFRPAIRKSTVFPFIYIASALLLLAMSFKLWATFFGEQPLLLMGLLILNCMIWVVMGRYLKLLYFTISGLLGLILIAGFLILQF